MSKEQKEKLLHAFDEGWNKGNLEFMANLCAPGFIHFRPPFPPIKGASAEKQDIAETFKAFSEIKFTVHELVMEGDTAVMRWKWQAKQVSKSPDLPDVPLGNEVTMDGCSILHLSAGKIIEEWEFADYLGYFTQLGAIPKLP